MPTTLNSGLQLPDKGSVDWYGSMQTNYNLLDNHLENTDIHVTAEDKANWDSKQGSLSQAQLDAIAQVATNTNDIATLQSGKANASHTHTSSELTDIGDFATKSYVDNSISGLVDNAPAALDTLKELSTALNDDANFASTVTTALSAKANSADLATVATSGSYNDLSNKPTINDSTITIQKNGTLVGTFTVNGSAKTIDIPVPTKTSDLTNDSNFVDNTDPAVASGITSAKVTDYDTHLANTDIHVTAADKQKWNDNVSQSYVLRYSSTVITDNSTIAYSTLDNTDNIKASDKIIDSDGKIFSIASVDTTNQTVTVGSALIDLALDANVVHTSGNETVGGQKTFSDNTFFTANVYHKYTSYESGNIPANNLVSNVYLADKNDVYVGYLRNVIYTSGRTSTEIRAKNTIKNGVLDPTGDDISSNLNVEVQPNGVKTIYWDGLIRNDVTPFTTGNNFLGTSANKWKALNGINPGALWLPSTAYVDISAYITDLSGGSNQYTAPDNGIVAVDISGTIRYVLYNNNLGFGDRLTGSSFRRAGIIQVRKNDTVIIQSSGGTLNYAYFYPCLGNV